MGLAIFAIALILWGVFVARGGSGDTRGAEPAAAAPAATAVPDADLFARCETFVAAKNWAEAIRDCRTLRARDPDYDGLADQLAAAYVGRGEQHLATGDDLAAAAGDFEQALVYQPESAEAQRALQQLTLYRQADQALGTADWETAVAQFSALHADAPDYLQNLGDRSAGAKLFTAWLRWGESALNADALPSAAARCEQALALVPEDPEAQRCVAAATAPVATGGSQAETAD